MQIKFVIPGKPIRKTRPRFARKGKFVVTYNDQETEEGRTLWHIQQQLQNMPPECPRRFEKDVPISIFLRFQMPIPKSTPKKIQRIMERVDVPHIKKPDIDNLVKFYLDCLAGEVFHDDNQIYSITAEKVYSTHRATLIMIRSAT